MGKIAGNTGLLLLVLTGFFLQPVAVFSQQIPVDSIENPDFIQKLITYDKTYPFINYHENIVEWCNYSAVGNFFEKFKQSSVRKLRILHLGDSHLQTDYLSGLMRRRLQEMLGYGGRGFVFPYNAAGTHSAYDYRTPCKGTWTYCKNIQANPAYDMGLHGATVRTTDTAASFRFVFLYESLKPQFTRLKIYVKQSPKSFNLKLKIKGYPDTIRINCNRTSQLPYVKVDLPMISDTLDFFIDRSSPDQDFFECYGLSFENPAKSGALYHSAGINGAGYKSLLRQNLMPVQLKELKPDLVILDLGGNDFSAGRFYPAELKKDVAAVVDIIKEASPETNILLTNCQDFYRRRVNVGECQQFAELIKEVAIAKNCAFYNYYNVSGGRYSMSKWLTNGLAQRDKIHLSHTGYHVRGELLLNALLHSYQFTLTRGKTDTLLVRLLDTANIKAIAEAAQINTKDLIARSLNEKRDPSGYHVVNAKNGSAGTSSANSGNKTYYKIRSGDNLGSIAERFGVSVSQLQKWNNIRGTTIYAGQTLVIYRGGSQPASDQKQSTSGGGGSPGSGKPITHKVMPGDTLWDISMKYKVPVEEIKKLNNLRENNLKVGQILKIRG